MVTVKMRSPASHGRGWDEETFTGEVVPNFRWLTDAQMCLTTGRPSFPVRVLEKKWITSIDGVEPAPRVQRVEPRTRLVVGSRGATHVVSVESDGTRSCSCPGFTYRRTCRHSRDDST
jgi:hypothetical protein